MAPVVIVGVNSWQTISEADDYFAAKFGAAAWGVLLALQKTQLLITAFNWIRQQVSLSVPTTAVAVAVKQAQCEAAWFVYNYNDDYEKRRALTSSGVRSYKALDVSESLSEVDFPSFLAGILSDYATNLSSSIVSVARDLEDNSYE
jgi:hypothetical protein